MELAGPLKRTVFHPRLNRAFVLPPHHNYPQDKNDSKPNPPIPLSPDSRRNIMRETEDPP